MHRGLCCKLTGYDALWAPNPQSESQDDDRSLEPRRYGSFTSDFFASADRDRLVGRADERWTINVLAYVSCERRPSGQQQILVAVRLTT